MPNPKVAVINQKPITNLIRGTQVKYRVVGSRTPATLQARKLISRHMSWQVLEEDHHFGGAARSALY